jgi:hypothetical protein
MTAVCVVIEIPEVKTAEVRDEVDCIFNEVTHEQLDPVERAIRPCSTRFHLLIL